MRSPSQWCWPLWFPEVQKYTSKLGRMRIAVVQLQSCLPAEQRCSCFTKPLDNTKWKESQEWGCISTFINGFSWKPAGFSLGHQWRHETMKPWNSAQATTEILPRLHIPALQAQPQHVMGCTLPRPLAWKSDMAMRSPKKSIYGV